MEVPAPREGIELKKPYRHYDLVFGALSLLCINAAGKKGNRSNTIAVVPALRYTRLANGHLWSARCEPTMSAPNKATLRIESISEYPRPSHPLGVARAARSRVASSARLEKNPFCDSMKIARSHVE